MNRPGRVRWYFGLTTAVFIAPSPGGRGDVSGNADVYGKRTWLIHGVLVDLFFCTTIAFTVQRTKNTSVSFLIHLLYNEVTPVFLLLVVLGAIH